ncbi:hypothetical protein F2Q68_00025494 [Brassica cretica]|uniref:Uncharacterized protein n=1 Tax=Brassica cretica TaxID=69181 RepID=A0A8S9IIL8_BRACR|nr:hypothetical protein F2Q68_00025494 [Brassica cretica]
MKSRDGKINIWKEDNNKALIDEAENAEFHSLSNQTLRSQTDQTPNPFGQSKPDKHEPRNLHESSILDHHVLNLVYHTRTARKRLTADLES